MRKNILILIIVVVAAAAIGGVLWYKKHHNATNSGTMLKDRQVNLTADQQKIYTDRIAKANDYLKNLDPKMQGYHAERSNTYVYLAQQYYGLGQLEKAKEMYQTALQEAPVNEDATTGLANTLAAGGDQAGAVQLWQQEVKAHPTNYNSWLQYIQLKQSMGASTDEINSLYGQAVLNTNYYPDVLTRDAEFQEKIGSTSTAISLWQKAAQQNPQGATQYNAQIKRLGGK